MNKKLLVALQVCVEALWDAESTSDWQDCTKLFRQHKDGVQGFIHSIESVIAEAKNKNES